MRRAWPAVPCVAVAEFGLQPGDQLLIETGSGSLWYPPQRGNGLTESPLHSEPAELPLAWAYRRQGFRSDGLPSDLPSGG